MLVIITRRHPFRFFYIRNKYIAVHASGAMYLNICKVFRHFVCCSIDRERYESKMLWRLAAYGPASRGTGIDNQFINLCKSDSLYIPMSVRIAF